MSRSILVLTLLALSTPALAQDCASWPLLHPGASSTAATLNPKGKETGRTVTTTLSAAGDTARVHAETLDPKGKVESTVDYDVTCRDGAWTVDGRAFLPQEQVEAYQGYDMSVQTAGLEYPAGLVAGQGLPDASVHVTFTLKDAAPGTPAALTTVGMNMTIRDRKVEALESVTVPAGTFDAARISWNSETPMTGLIPMKVQLHVVEWFVPGVGQVKTEMSRAGKAAGSTQLVELKKP
jgi:hypothetical protein